MDQSHSCQLVKKFPALYGTLNFITAFPNARHLRLRNPSRTEIKYFKMLRKVYATGWKVRGSISSRERDFSVLQTFQAGSEAHPSSYSMDKVVLSMG